MYAVNPKRINGTPAAKPQTSIDLYVVCLHASSLQGAETTDQNKSNNMWQKATQSAASNQ